MKFPYWIVQREHESRLLPMVPVTLVGPSRRVEIVALVDSGAEHSVFGADLADQLGFPHHNGTPVTVVGVGGQQTPGRLLEVALQLGPHRWNTSAIFSEAGNRRAILGQAGFFAFFTVTFRYYARTMDIRRARTA